MDAILNVYEGCESTEPIKTFTCKRMTFKAANDFEELANQVNALNSEREEKGTSKERRKEIDEEIVNLQVEIIQLFFPSFTKEDFYGVDFYEYQNFCMAVGQMRGKVFERAQKN